MGTENQKRIANDTTALNVLRQAALQLQRDGKASDLVACSALLVALDLVVQSRGKEAAAKWLATASHFLLQTYPDLAGAEIIHVPPVIN